MVQEYAPTSGGMHGSLALQGYLRTRMQSHPHAAELSVSEAQSTALMPHQQTKISKQCSYKVGVAESAWSQLISHGEHGGKNREVAICKLIDCREGFSSIASAWKCGATNNNNKKEETHGRQAHACMHIMT